MTEQKHTLLYRGKRVLKVEHIPVKVNAPPKPTEQDLPIQALASLEEDKKTKPVPETSSKATIHTTVIIVNYKTEQLIKQAYESLRQFYPNIKVILVDNGSGDNSVNWIQAQTGKPNVTVVLNERNLGHGPAMHHAITEQVSTTYVFTLDSDCVILSGSWLEQMYAIAEGERLYAIGWQRYVDRSSGVPLEWHLDNPPSDRFIAYIHPAASLYNVSLYNKIAGFSHHGAPCLANMVAANTAGYPLRAFPIFQYIKHLTAGTRRMYAGRWDPKDTDKPSSWDAGSSYPI